jgi:hypothetical protein
MLVAHEERFQRIYSDYRDRPSGDYAELLRRGEVISREGVDAEAWRCGDPPPGAPGQGSRDDVLVGRARVRDAQQSAAAHSGMS